MTRQHQPRERMGGFLNVRLPLPVMQRLEQSADDLGVSVSDVAREALTAGLNAAHASIADGIERSQRGEPLGP